MIVRYYDEVIDSYRSWAQSCDFFNFIVLLVGSIGVSMPNICFPEVIILTILGGVGGVGGWVEWSKN